VKAEHSHDPEDIAERLEKGTKHSYLRDWVYGGIDGSVTTFAIISSVEGANFTQKAIIIFGIANILADGFSMAASNFLGTQSEQEELEHWREVEKRHVSQHPEGETEEVRQLLGKKGFKGDLLEKSTRFIVGNQKRWIDFMLVEEYGLPLEIRSPMKASLATFASFAICGGIPLLPFLLGLENAFLIASIVTGMTFFLIGSVKSRWSSSSWLKTGSFTLLLGGIASLLAYAVGNLLSGI